MDFLNLRKPTNVKLTTGKLLIAEPFLADPNFTRSVILLCEHSDEGSVGFILNRSTELTLGDLLPDLYTPLLPINQGGPVQLDTLHMLHRMPVQFGGNEIFPGVYWGGSYEALQEVIVNNEYQPIDLRLFVGYAGWSPGQLEAEIKEGAWLVSDLTQDILFETEPDRVWKQAIKSLGQDYSYLANLPLNPQLN
ncbi:MAG: YqgE/AlgH family protein [Sphingobacteriales bacterium]|nr:MAG: YqgE/AlgH family protein [Sphingobacteriales bacterium]